MMTFNEIKQVKSNSNNVKVTIEKIFTRSSGNSDDTFITFKITKLHDPEERYIYRASYSDDDEEYIRQAASSCHNNDECPED